MANRRSGPRGPIRSGELYPIDYLGAGPYALRTMRERGMKFFIVAGRTMFKGDDYISYVSSLPPAPLPPPRPKRERVTA